jgi:mycothiol synthase
MPQLPDPLEGVTWRPLRADDADELHRLVRASETADGVPFVTSLDEIRRQLADPESDLANDSIAALLPDGRMAAFGACRMRPEASRRRAVSQEGTVHPELRRRGLGSAVMEWTEARGRERVAGFSDGVPQFLEVFSNESWNDRRAFLSARAYEPIRYYDDMERPLGDPIPVPTLPAGLRFDGWTPERDELFRMAHNDAFRDHWGSEPLSSETWGHRVSGSQHFRPDLTVGAFQGDDLIGYCTAYHAPEDAEVTGRQEGWLGQIGVRRDWRGRGVAAAVMAHVMRAFAGEGMDYACLGVDSENPTGAVGLYTRLGFRRFERWIRWAKPAD